METQLHEVRNYMCRWTKYVPNVYIIEQPLNKIWTIIIHNTELSPKSIEQALDNLLTSTKPQLVKLKKLKATMSINSYQKYMLYTDF